MKWWRRFFVQLKRGFWRIMNTIKTGKFSSKPKRPRVQRIIILDVVDGEPILCERYIIINEKGETLEAPIFLTKEDAENWLDEYHPKYNYSPDY